MIRDSEIQNYLGYLEKNGNFERLTTNLDNTRAPIHRWFPFLAGFSHKLVTETINYFDLEKKNYFLFDPFIGSGTTGVVAKGLNVDVIGNESNKFLYKICRIKICAPPSIDGLATTGEILLKEAKKSWKSTNLTNENPLLEKCYSKNNLKKMIALREVINADLDVPLKHNRYLFLALTMSLPKLSNFSINVPYLSWNCKRTPEETFSSFKKSLGIITEDLRKFTYKDNGSSCARVYLHDSRKQNDKIKDSSIDMIFTSPPYLNNLDYGEALKVFLYFWKMVNNWHEITEKIRRPAIASSTTHYKESAISSKSPEEILGDDFLRNFPIISQEIINKVEKIRKVRKLKLPEKTKSFDILTALYFKDMSLVLKEMYRVLKYDSLAFLILGDSAPYGVHILTDNLLGEMAVELGFSSFTLKPLRIRGTKWVTLKHRHKRILRESLLILRR
jgi:DNA modification methylase